MTSGVPKSTLRQRQNPSGLTLTGFLIALSFVAMIVPLALFHAAQVTAAVRLRTSLLLTLTSICVVLALGVVLGLPPLVAGGVGGLFWFPVFALVLRERLLLRPLWLSLLALCLPVFLLVAGVFVFPSEAEITQSLKALAQVAAAGSQGTSLKEMMDALESTPGALSDIMAFARLESWQRLAWLVFGDGVAWSLATIGVSLANLVFLDLAFEQVEKLKAVTRFMVRNPAAFPPPLVEAVGSMVGGGAPSRGEANMEVKGVYRRMEDPDETPPLLSFMLRPLPRAGRVLLWGYEFELGFIRPSWNLRRFSLPLPLLLGAVLALGGLVAYFGSPGGVVTASSGHPWMALVSFGALVLVTVVALQGLLVLLERLTPGFLLALVVLVFLVAAFVEANAFLVLGGLGLVGILDYAYGFRGHVAKRTKAV